MNAKNSSCNRKDDVLPRVFNKTHPHKKCVNVFEEYVMHVYKCEETWIFLSTDQPLIMKKLLQNTTVNYKFMLQINV